MGGFSPECIEKLLMPVASDDEGHPLADVGVNLRTKTDNDIE
jgi:hypothetical protein